MANPTVTLIGRLGQDPSEISNGGLRLRIATNDRVKNDTTGQWEDKDTSWWTVKVWGTKADQLRNVLKKGQEVVAIGKMKEENWVKDGVERNSYEISSADTVAVTGYSLSKGVTPTNAGWDMASETPF